MNFTEFFTLAVLHFFAVIAPGPDFALILGISLDQNRKQAYLASVGLGFGILIHTFFAIFGLSAILSYSAPAFLAIKILGGLYLIWIGLQMSGLINLKSKKQKESKLVTNKNNFAQGFLTNILNPKVALFFVAIFSQTVSPETTINSKLIYGLEMSIVTSLWFCLVATIFTNSKLKSIFSKYIGFIVKFTGIGMIGLGIKTIFSK